MRGSLYAIVDIKAEDILGQPVIYKHPAAAIRFFDDVATHPESTVGRHPEDYNLVILGHITEQLTLELPDGNPVVITGTAWKASKQLPSPKAQ